MATPAHVWTAAFRQAGVPEVYGLDELADALLAFQVLGRLPGRQAAVLTGVWGGGGGAAVAASDALARAGLEMASILPETGRRIASLIGEIGSIFINPVDVSQARGRLPVLRQCLEALAADPGVDFLLVQEEIDVMLRGRGWEDVSAFNAFVCEVKQSLSRPLVMVLPTGLSEEYRQKAADSFTSCGIPVFPSATRAAGALAVVARYQDYHRPAVLH
jgi:acyl-CoA synthetase (NDP forming)